MNVLILTPDAVGSTLLQRLITIYMQFHQFDRPVINLHELTNGLEKYFSPEFNQEILSKSRVQNWGYYQDLETVVRLLSSVDHYKTSRLAHYHLRNRQDPPAQQIPFFRYLDENFFVIACRRRNIFEHALSMAINKVTKRLNVYSAEEKITSFLDLYNQKIQLDQTSLTQSLEAYKSYLEWSENYFSIASYFVYEDHVPCIEQYILDLPIFASQPNKITWQKNFGIDLNDWNRCHHMPSDIGSLFLEGVNVKEKLQHCTQDNLISLYQTYALPEWPAIHNEQDLQQIADDMIKIVAQKSMVAQTTSLVINESNQAYLAAHVDGYRKANSAIDKMKELDILISPPPIKKQTLHEKHFMISNFDQCLDTYNDWTAKNTDICQALTRDDLNAQIQSENAFWHRPKSAGAVGISAQLSIEMSARQNDDGP